eukprot:CAMPEP_0197450582 /NCGR_PEP_ID=MMETSP1175-20131217/25809_1 /TAXON_ID=1003142 /ORGANISM="Triceratium dubium, Strain CCMP147" /LENGTH=188 /DNA_ID=CAMNT_0042983035 /DNA_START=30 /DNA_END=596 /DNA_ORIENTATION=-
MFRLATSAFGAPLMAARRAATTKTTMPIMSTAARFMSAEAADGAAVASDKHEDLILSLSVPERSLVDAKPVERVTLPGRGGTYGVEKNMPPSVSELRPGVVLVDYGKGETEQFFIPGGFAFCNPNNTITVSAPEGVRLEDIDADRIRGEAEALNQQLASAAKGSREESEALVGLEVYKALGHALNVTV